ncbi:hypothetical protein M9H77_14967 [Catharanthus roseus]|uniref:Uncharacterized protein n=1 Tax=Catharanthus roseus TaxID=4058 RepID=A0ACC0BPP0_CATRO|nr:hypothetical protein M9H77_14967 [Catharanthus roseus]
MLGSSSGGHDQQQEEQEDNLIQNRSSLNSPAIHMRQLLITCAELISTNSDLSSAHRLLTILLTNSTPYGDSTERLVHQFAKSLSLRLNRNGNFGSSGSVQSSNEAADLLQSSYLSLNQITPFIRFTQLTANQAILDSIEGQQEGIHILDFNIMHGLQWPPFMQAIAERYPPLSLRITAAGTDSQILRRTGDRLSKFAHSLGLRFQFQPILLVNEDDVVSVVVNNLLPGETLAVNFVLYLHRLLKDREKLGIFLHRIKSMNPKIVTVAEREANHNHPLLLQRFVEALDHYAAVFDSLEATLPPNSRERINVETTWFGREIYDIVCGEGIERRERHERYRCWEMMMRSSGFSNVELSGFAFSQAKLLLRLHYPSEGYQLHTLNNHNSFFLGWQNQPLFSVSSWH